MIDEAVLVAEWPSLDVAVKLVIVEPPSLPGVNVTMALPSPRVAATSVGAPGTVAGITGLLAVEDALVPLALVAVTVKV